MGRNFQRRDDHSGRDRSFGPSLLNPGTEHPELPHGASQEESGRRLGVRGSQLTIVLISTIKMRRPRAVEKAGRWKARKTKKQVFLPSHRPWKSRKTRGIPTFPTAPDCCWYLSNKIGNSSCR